MLSPNYVKVTRKDLSKMPTLLFSSWPNVFIELLPHLLSSRIFKTSYILILKLFWNASDMPKFILIRMDLK